MRKMKLAAAVMLAAMTAAGPANAVQISANMNVKITITNQCKVSTPTSMDFGSYGVLDTAVDTTASFSVTCTTSQGYTVGFGAGNGSGASTTTRKMTLGANTVDYQLFKNTARLPADNWGIAGGELVAATGNGTAQTYTVYGRVPAQSTPPAGDYTDTVAVTVTY